MNVNNSNILILRAFVLFVVAFFVAGTAFSKSLLEANAIDFNPHSQEGPKELFIPLGFDEDKKFAYLYKTVPENVACTLWSLTIVNLSSDKVLSHIETPFHDCGESDDSALLDNFELKVNATLKQHNIIARDITLEAFPLHFVDKKIDACVSVRNESFTEGAFTEYNRRIIIFDKVNHQAKIIANFTEVKFASVLKVYDPKIEGYFQNPTTKRLAVVMSFSLGGHNPEDYIRRVNIYGSGTNMKNNGQLISMCEKTR